jgi:light-regulated signal transduction histidine kinase (bacteriophytochrome)
MHSNSTENSNVNYSSWSEHSLAMQLERAKGELELIAYVMSHDLKSPIRAISSACEELNKSTIPDKAANAALKDLSRESARMKLLMDGLLDYLNLETYGPCRNKVDISEVLSTAHTILEEKIRSSGAKITFDALPEVFGHRGRYTRLFVYMLDNAIKFCKSDVPRISISAHAVQNSDFEEFRIRDNGIGIEEEHNEIIFQLFQRLHGADAYPGNGIGLALCRKIVESNGGKLWVEQEPEGGSCFCFTLPRISLE